VLVACFLQGGQPARAEAFYRRFRALSAALPPGDPALDVWVYDTRAFFALYNGALEEAASAFEATAACFDALGNLRGAASTRSNLGYTYLCLGAYGEAELVLREALRESKRLALTHLSAVIKQNLGGVLAHRGALAEARALEMEAAALFEAQKNPRLEGAARVYLAQVLARAGEIDSARAELDLAEAALAGSPRGRARALAARARIELVRGRHAAAFDAASEAVALIAPLGGDEDEVKIRLALAEATEAGGDREGARRALAAARAALLDRAAKLSDERWRQSYLERVPEHARTLALASFWGLPEPD